VEVHKTVDHATYHKASDVGQMLIVYEDEYAMEEAENAPGYKVEGFPSYYHSGLTPPMKRVVRRRFLSRFKERDVKPVPPRRIDVQNVEEEIKKLIEKLSDKGKVGKGRKGAAPLPKDRIITEIEEEIVDYEPWMGDGGTFTLEDAKSHPEWWLSKSEIKEIEDAKAKELRKEREAAEALQAEMEAQRLAEEAAAEKKAKKQKKKKEKKKKQQEEDMAMQETQYAQSAVVAAAEEMDEVTAAAMMINQEIDNEELLLDDDMFDFANEDISDLL
jgi:transcription initiation factor TFIID subunit 7